MRSIFPKLLSEGVQSGRRVIFGEVVAASDTIEVCYANASKTSAADRCQLVITLRAEIVVVEDIYPAHGALRGNGLPKQKIKHRARAARHEQTDHDPETGTHGPSGSIFRDVADSQEIKRGYRTPRQRKIDAEADWGSGMMLCLRDDYPVDVLHPYKCRDCKNN